MGLDIVELVMEVEDTFGIKIEDAEYEQVRTVGALHDLIVRKGGHADQKPQASSHREPATCLSLVGFVQLRRALTTLFAVPRNMIRPTTTLDSLVPVDQRRLRWCELERALGLKVPGLSRPPWMEKSFALSWVVLIVGSILLAALGVAHFGELIFGFIVAAMSLALLSRLSAPSANYLDPALCTVGGLSKGIVALNYTHFAAKFLVPPREEVMFKLVSIISEQLCIPADQITPEKRFVEDLLCD